MRFSTLLSLLAASCSAATAATMQASDDAGPTTSRASISPASLGQQVIATERQRSTRVASHRARAVPVAESNANYELIPFEEAGPFARSELSCEPCCVFRQWFVTADYLYLTPRRGGLEFAIVDPNQNDFPEGPVESLEWSGNSGFRLGIGTRGPAGWQTTAQWTHLDAADSRSLTAPAGGKLWTLMTHPEVVEGADSATAAIDVNYDVLDVLIKHCVVTQDTFALHIDGGLRFAWIDTQTDVLYDSRNPNAIVDADNTRVLRQSDFFGWGLQLGAEGTRRLWGNWRLFGRAGTSLLLGYTDTRLLETHQGTTVHANVTQELVEVVPVTDLSLGLAWHCGRWQIRGGYEFTHWFNLFSERDFVDDVNEGKSANLRSDFSLDGLFLRAGWIW